MPTYEYKCKVCGHTVTKTCPISERKVEVECSECGGMMKQVLGAPGIKWNTTGRTVRTMPKGSR
jgi:putative FmdB family regulatory protein